jgi:uncharacterized membrane protein
MSNVPATTNKKRTRQKAHPFRRAVLRGLGVVLPPLLTIVLFFWAWNLILDYVLEPVESGARWVIVQVIWDVHSEQPPESETAQYEKIESDQWIPKRIYREVKDKPGNDPPKTAQAYFDRFVTVRYLQRIPTIVLFFAVFILILYVLGKFLAAGMGRLMLASFEGLIHRLPVIRNVYSSVKQVTDFIFTEREIEFNRVVAVEYPRKGIWSIGFVTGESMLDIRSAANEPVLSVLMPTSPMPATGFTITVRKDETIDLDITIDQAIQFVVSCGVVIPPHQQHSDDVSTQIAAAMSSKAALPESAVEVPSVAPSSGGEPEQDDHQLEEAAEQTSP